MNGSDNEGDTNNQIEGASIVHPLPEKRQLSLKRRTIISGDGSVRSSKTYISNLEK